ncbi:hypothetical protein SLEP1_g1376 [Rubroshorea leprosula]|uniref:Bet v I/Major latex protein domain-containing protein n=1 Tax=Rubroshorea leprosula TaxID=152421 RepID=A0AAV5HI83_9ROSI|nr:hypothetical protein SLEP1_g1376 [Rubroshorea leprosula]
MGITTVTEEISASIPPSRMFKALILDSHILIPKLVPQSFKNIEFLHGDGEVGTIKQTNFAEGSHFKFMKHKIEALDVDNFYCKYSLIEGDVLGDTLESITYEVKFEAAGAGSVCKMSSHYHTKGDLVFKEEEIKAGKDKAAGMYKLVEEYLVANPDVYA